VLAAPQNASHVRQRRFLVKSQQNNLPVFFRQPVNAVANMRDASFRAAASAGDGSGEAAFSCQATRFSRSETGRRPVPPVGRKRDDAILMAMQEDGIQPGREPAGLIVTRQALPGLDEGFRNEIVRHAEIATQRRSLAEQAGLQRLDQSAKRLRISGTRLRQKFTGINYFDPVVSDVHLYINPRRERKRFSFPSFIFGPLEKSNGLVNKHEDSNFFTHSNLTIFSQKATSLNLLYTVDVSTQNGFASLRSMDHPI